MFIFAEGCRGGILALDGADGSLLWSIPTKDEVFELRCPALDMNNDGEIDCIGSGRHGTVLAFSPHTGQQAASHLPPRSCNNLCEISLCLPEITPFGDTSNFEGQQR